MEITLLGTGDTTGTPTVGCDCATCREAGERGVERTRFSVHLRNERTHESLLVDASPDFRTQLLRQPVSLPDALIVTHVHFDHLDGLGNVFRLRRDLPVYASDAVDEVTDESVAETVSRRYDYLRAVSVEPRSPGAPFEACGFTIRLVPVNHPPMASYGVSIVDEETGAHLALTGDTNYDVPDGTKEVLAGADVLLADAIVPASFCENHPAGGSHYADGIARTFGSKHMTREGALALADELAVEDVGLVHLSHFYPPDEAFESPLTVDGDRFVL